MPARRVLSVVTLAAVACGAGVIVAAQGATSASPPALWRGTLIDVPTGASTFAPCGERFRLRVLDESPARDLWRVYADVVEAPGQRIYVEVIAQRRGSRLEVLEVRRALAEGLGCREDLAGILLKAVGHEPFWRLQVERTTVRFERFGDDDWTVFPPGDLEETDGIRTLETSASGTSLHLTVTPTRCHDTMADAIYGFTAVVRVGDVEYRGCAYEGVAREGRRGSR